MNLMRGAAGGLAILAATVGGVAAVAFALGAWIAPAASLAEPTPTPRPSFDLAVPPEAIGGSLEISGDRSGTMTLDEATGTGSRQEIRDDGGVVVMPAEDTVVLRGADGHLRFERDTGAVTHIAYDGLSIYVDPGQCEVTHGAVNEGNDLMAALVECPEVADVRGQGVVTVRGTIALPADALLGRGDLPPTGGSLEVDASTITLDEVEISLDLQPPDETGRIASGVFDADSASGIVLEYEPEADRWFLRHASSGDEQATLEEACPIAAEELGDLNDYTTVMRLDIDCTDVAVEGGGTGSVTGTVIADVIRGYTESVTEP